MLPELAAAIEAMPKAQHLAFLVTERGEPFTAAGFGNWFRDQCDSAGIADLSAHGLRKAGATRLAECGATDHEIMSWGGWKTLREVQRYTAAANRKRLALRAADQIKSGTELANLDIRFAKKGENLRTNRDGDPAGFEPATFSLEGCCFASLLARGKLWGNLWDISTRCC